MLTKSRKYFYRLLLKYVSRDEVVVLGQGAGGVPEMRNSINAFNEQSALYGLLQYRRRKVVIKYMPEGLSRLLQGTDTLFPYWTPKPGITNEMMYQLTCPQPVRTGVHFQTVLEKFSPYDTVFTFTQPSDLTEGSLSSACLLHTATGSVASSSSSLRRRKLMEITEDAEENCATKYEVQSLPLDTTAKRPTSMMSAATIVPSQVESNVERPPSRGAESQVPNDDASENMPIARSLAQPSSSRRYHDVENPVAAASSYDGRNSSQLARQASRDPEHSYVPKVKRGPRPSMDFKGRPRTAGSMSRSHDQRPVASLPSTVRMPSTSSSKRSNHHRPSDFTIRPRSQPGSAAVLHDKNAPPVPPLLLVPPPPILTGVPRPQISSSAKSMSAVSASGLTPEKERLMKALHLRRKQMEKQAELKKKQQSSNNNTADNNNSSTDQAGNVSGALVGGGDNGMEIQGLTPTREPQGESSTGESRMGENHHQNSQHQQHSAPESARANEESKTTRPEDSKNDSNMDETISVTELKKDSELPIPPAPVANDAITPNVSPETLSSPTPGKADIAPPDNSDAADPVQQQVDTEAKPALTDDKQPDATPVESHTEAGTEKKEGISQTEIPGAKIQAHEQSLSEVHESQPCTPDGGAAKTANEASTTQPTPGSSEMTVEDVDEDGPQENGGSGSERILTPAAEFSDDDKPRSDGSIFDELKGSTVEEAKPVILPKQAPFAKGSNMVDTSKSPRAFSNPTTVSRTPSQVQTLPIGRSMSSSYSENRSVSPVPAARKINVSSGISSRIKALEKLSQPASPTALSNPSATFESVKKRSSTLSTNSDPRRSSYIAPSSASTPRAPTPSRSASAAPHSDALRTGESSEQGLRHSQLNPLPTESTVTDEKAKRPAPTVLTALSDRSNSSSALSVTARYEHPASSPTRRPESPLSSSTHSSTQASSINNHSQSVDEKKESRTSRLFRRMSSIRPAPRKNAVNPLNTNQEEGTPEKVHGSVPHPKQVTVSRAVDIGEVNVQFPDTLLWKRRFMRIDETGCLVLLSANNKDFGTRNITKRYPMSEFKMPCLPDEDRQKLPNSIVLDFLDGSTIQCACESRQGQNNVLRGECSITFWDPTDGEC